MILVNPATGGCDKEAGSMDFDMNLSLECG